VTGGILAFLQPSVSPAFLFVGLAGLALLLAYLTYVLIERPVRDRKRFTRNEVFACGLNP